MKNRFIDVIARELAIHLFGSHSYALQERSLLERETARFLRKEFDFLDGAEDRQWTSVNDSCPQVERVEDVYLVPKGRVYMSKPVLVKKDVSDLDFKDLKEEFRYEIARFKTYDDGEPEWTNQYGRVIAWMEIQE